MSGFFGYGMIGPVSQPGPLRQSSRAYGVAWLGDDQVVLSCCAPYSL